MIYLTLHEALRRCQASQVMSPESHAWRGWEGGDEKGANWRPKVIPSNLTIPVIYNTILPIPVIFTTTALRVVCDPFG